MKYQYKYVPVPEGYVIRGKDSHAGVISEYDKLVNGMASQGWEYVGVDHVTSEYSRGCLQTLMAIIPFVGLFMRKEEEVRFKMILFRRPA